MNISLQICNVKLDDWQGAGQALEDSYILGRLLGHPKTTLQTLHSSLVIYDEVRRPRGNKVLEYSLEVSFHTVNQSVV